MQCTNQAHPLFLLRSHVTNRPSRLRCLDLASWRFPFNGWSPKPLGGAQHASVGFICQLMQQAGVFRIRLGKCQSLISYGAGVGHGMDPKQQNKDGSLKPGIVPVQKLRRIIVGWQGALGYHGREVRALASGNKRQKTRVVTLGHVSRVSCTVSARPQAPHLQKAGAVSRSCRWPFGVGPALMEET
jgi:hypothetical protein